MSTEDTALDERPAMEVTIGEDKEKPNVRHIDDDGGLELRVKRGEDKVDGAEELRQQLETERRAREAAERRANEVETGFAAERQNVQMGRMAADYREVSTALDAINVKTEDAARRYQEALEQGDFQVAAKVQVEIAELAADKRDAERFKYKVERAIEQANRQPPEARQQPKQTGDTLEDALAQMSKPTADWLRKNPEYVTDPRKNALAMSAHHAALAEGILPDSGPYFAFIEERLGMRDGNEKQERPRARVVEREAPVAAPVSNRATSSSVGIAQQRVTLTRAEVEFCNLNDIDPEVYAKEKVQLAAEGRLGVR